MNPAKVRPAPWRPKNNPTASTRTTAPSEADNKAGRSGTCRRLCTANRTDNRSQ